MGFFGDLFMGAVEFVGGVVDYVTDKVDDVVTWFSDKLGGSSSYSGTSVQETIDVEKELSKFRENISDKAKQAEEKSISGVMFQFNVFIRELESHYPGLVAAVKKEQETVIRSLKGTIVDYARKHISENDPDFRAVLEMQPGKQKKDALRKKMNDILDNAQSFFDRKLGQSIKKLNEELGRRLESELATKEQQLKEETSQYKELERQARSGTIDLEALEGEHTLLAETTYCLQGLLYGGDER